MIIISTDEKHYVHEAFSKLNNVKKEHLELGDFIVNNVIIERKQINDLYQSVFDGRLFKQMQTFKHFHEENPDAVMILLVEGYKLNKNLKKYKNVFTLHEILINIFVEFGVIPYKTNGLNDTVEFIKKLNNYQVYDKKILKQIRGHKRNKTLEEQKLYILMGFPTIGVKTAEKIINEYKTLENFFNALKTTKKYKKIKEVYEQ